MICSPLTNHDILHAITEFNNCLIIRSPSLFCNEYLPEAKRSAIFTQERSLKEGEQNIICSQTQLDDIAPEQTIICRSHGRISANKKEEKLHRMIITFSFLGVLPFPKTKLKGLVSRET